MTLSEIIDQYFIDERENIDDVTAEIMQELLKQPDLLVALLHPVLKARIHQHLRIRALNAERDSDLGTSPSVDPTADRNAFLQERFYVPGVGFVTWGAATIAHHQARIDYLMVKVAGIEETAQRHEAAIAEIKKAKATNLNGARKKKSVA